VRDRENKLVYPYIPNSVPAVQREMLDAIGVSRIDDLYELIPESLRFAGELDIPQPFPDEYSLNRHMQGLLARNVSCTEVLCFLGGGAALHYVPAICDVINQRSEFLTAYAGSPYEDHGRYQALFEYASMVGELVDMDVVSVPTYDGSQAAATSLRMACRITGRRKVLVPRAMNPDRLSIIRNYAHPDISVIPLEYERGTGLLDLEDLEQHLSTEIAAVYIENPTYLGTIEGQAQQISDWAHAVGALSVVGVDPISLGVLAPPPQYGADIVCGELQSLGIHLFYGGGRGGFIATPDEERFVSEYPTRLFGIAPTVDGAWGFGDVAWGRTSFARRQSSKEFVGTMASLWGITAGVYLALMGPKGMQEIGEVIMQMSAYAAARLSEIPGVRGTVFSSPHFSEFVVDFGGTGRSVAEINKALLQHGIFGGVDLSATFPELGQSALYAVTEVHTEQDIERLLSALRAILA